MAESETNLSIEETNKLRAELGLAPLVDTDKKKADFVHVPATNISNDLLTAKEREKEKNTNIRAFIDKELNKESGRKVKKQTTEDFLAEVINKSKLIEHRNEFKEIEQRIVKDPSSYSSEHLSGLTVEHKPKNFDNNVPVILTLKDKDILEDKEEVLVNLNLLEDEKAKKSIRDRKIGYYQDPLDSDEDDDLVKMGLKDRKLLGKYDEEEKPYFKLSASGGYNMREEMLEKERLQKMARGEISLNDTEIRIAPDISQDEMLAKISNKRRVGRIRKAPPSKKSFDDIKTEEGEVEEDKSSKSTNVKAEKKEPQIIEDESDEDGFMFASSIVNIPQQTTVANEAVERNLCHLKNLKREKVDININRYMNESDYKDVERPVKSNKTGQRKKDEIDSINIIQQFTMDVERSMLEKAKLSKNQKEQEKPMPVVKKEKSPTPPPKTPEPVEEEPIVTSGWQPEEALLEQSSSKQSRKRKSTNNGLTIYKTSKPQPPKKITIQDGILGDEIHVDKSLYAAVLYAQKKGYLDDEKKKKQESIITNPKTAQALKAQNFYEEKQRYEDPSEMKMPRRERQTGPLSKFDDKYDFNPDVKLEYIDDYGQQQEPKEAFRSLSHRFHGKASGKIKTQKRKMKVEQDCNIVSTATEHAMNSKDRLYRRMKKDKSFCVTLTGKDKI